MNDNFENKKHTVFIENRESAEVVGINDVSSFNETDITASCDWGEVVIKGSDLHVEILDLQSGKLLVNGKITAIIYNEKTQVKGFFKKAFSY